MTFTDDDLKRLKENAEASGKDSTWYDGLSCGTIKALLARLKAAEAKANATYHRPDCYEQGLPTDCICGVSEFDKAWRKSKGEAG